MWSRHMSFTIRRQANICKTGAPMPPYAAPPYLDHCNKPKLALSRYLNLITTHPQRHVLPSLVNAAPPNPAERHKTSLVVPDRWVMVIYSSNTWMCQLSLRNIGLSSCSQRITQCRMQACGADSYSYHYPSFPSPFAPPSDHLNTTPTPSPNHLRTNFGSLSTSLPHYAKE